MRSIWSIPTTTHSWDSAARDCSRAPRETTIRPGPDGVLIRDSREIWAGDGNSTVKVFDVAGCERDHNAQAYNPHRLAADNRADEMCYDPVDQLILVANNAASPPFATLISTIASTCRWSKSSRSRQSPPMASSSASGVRGRACSISPFPGSKIRIMVTVQVAVINPATFAVQTTFDIPLANCDTPQGMAVGPAHDILIGCNGSDGRQTQSSVIIDERNGNILATVANEFGPRRGVVQSRQQPLLPGALIAAGGQQRSGLSTPGQGARYGH